MTPIFPARIDWHRADADAFWSPSIHWNSHLRQYVVLLNRARDKDWTQEGVYVTFYVPEAGRIGLSFSDQLLKLKITLH